MSASSSNGFSLAQNIEHGSILGLSPNLPEQVPVLPGTEPVMSSQVTAWPTEAGLETMIQLAVWTRLEDGPLPHPIARRLVPLYTTTPRWLIPPRRGIRPIPPPIRPRHPIQSPDPAPHYLYFAMPDALSLPDAHHGILRPQDDLDEEERAANPPINTATHVPQPSSPDDVHSQCRLLLPSGVRCTEWFFVSPNFARSSPYGVHLAQVHLIGLSASKTMDPWICTLERCRSRKAISVGALDPLTHIRTHLDHHVECTDCRTPFGRTSSLKRHRKKYCGSGEERAHKRARTLPGPRLFDCPD